MLSVTYGLGTSTGLSSTFLGVDLGFASVAFSTTFLGAGVATGLASATGGLVPALAGVEGLV